ncbi:hypothetical protein GUJ93_ZPchr0013g34092 [Zizania palustris]|uniref:non-specific serine/threonine protein kinase n=1 Tax=Zizania palustris TaxID=103762 RepID=A0A8J5X2X6_ZIZPA|nr:hypothetical protein GUJ93_ZPchr0013g34092 [Zizania palustris]
MGNCCGTPATEGGKNRRRKQKQKANPFTVAYNRGAAAPSGRPGLVVLRDPTGRDLGARYELGGELGRGEFGVTYLCTEAATGDKYACKSISKRKLRTPVDVEDVRREVDIMRHMPSHPNIVSLHAAYEDEDAVHLVMELCEGGELFDRIVARGALHRARRRRRHAHHRGGGPGLVCSAETDAQVSGLLKCWQSVYMAPEVLKRNYGPEVDVWSAGVILYILLCGVPPFWAETEQGVAQAIIRSVVDFKKEPWPRVSEPAKDLVRRMLDPNPITTAYCRTKHPWLHDSKKMPDIPLGDTVRAKLQQFAALNKLKKKALRVIAEHLSVEEAADIKDMFDKMDVNNNGKLTFEDFKAGIRKLGNQMPDSDIKMLMDAVSYY